MGARMVPFGGWEMPVQYTGILEEHEAVRTRAGLFDVSHMGEIEVRGPDTQAFVNRLVANDVSRLEDGQVLYTHFCNEHGGVIDDLLVYRLAADHDLLVVNAGTADKDWAWVQEKARAWPDLGVQVNNVSDRYAQLAVQGPKALAVLESLSSVSLADLGHHRFVTTKVAGVPCLVSRTGYTGEDGFELYFDPGQAVRLWEAILAAGRPLGLVPAGLGARDTLRFEAALPLYGHELEEDINPFEARCGIFVKLEKGDFVGRQALMRVKAEGPKRRLIGLEMMDRGIPRQGYRVYHGNDEVGVVTSGTYAPTLGKNLGIALVRSDVAKADEFLIDIRGRKLRARSVKLPFYRRDGQTEKGGAV